MTDLTASTGRTCERGSVPLPSVYDRAQLFLLSALALLVSVLGQLALAAILTAMPPGVFLVTLVRTSGLQDLVVLLWAAVSGVMFLLGVGRLVSMSRARLAALIGGAIGPWVILGLAQVEGHFWPSLRDTSGPLDRPLMTLPMLVCALLAPWLAGRAARARQ